MNLITDYIIALTNLYGLVHADKVAEIYNEQNGENVDAPHMKNQANHYDDELARHFIHAHGDYFVNESILMFDDFEEEWAKRQGKPFYVPDKEKLLKYKDESYIEQTDEYEALKAFVQWHLFNGDAHKAEIICEDIHAKSKYGFSLNEIFQDFDSMGVEFETKRQAAEMMELVVNLSNNVRLWENNGLTPNELFSQEDKKMLKPLPEDADDMSQKTTTNKKIGRNEPCPCGSGKKYKKCCLEKV